MVDPKTLVLAAGSLGDCILTLPALRALGKRFALTVAGTTYYEPFARSLPGVGETLIFQKVYEDILTGEAVDRLAGFSRVYLFFKDEDKSVEGRLEQAALPTHRPGKTFEAFLGEGVYVGEYWSRWVEETGIPVEDRVPRIDLSGEKRRQGVAALKSWGLNGPCVIHPGSGGSAKIAPIAFYADLARALVKKGREVLVVWGESESIFLPEIRKAFGLPGVLVQPQTIPLDLLAGILASCAAFYGNDSGVSHLAAACGVPTHVVFGPSDADIWAPAGSKVFRAGEKFIRLKEGPPADWLAPSRAGD